MSSNRYHDVEVQVLLPRDKQLPDNEGVIPAGTWATGWLDRDTWRRRGDQWQALVRYTVYGRRFPFGYLDHFPEAAIRLSPADVQGAERDDSSADAQAARGAATTVEPLGGSTSL